MSEADKFSSFLSLRLLAYQSVLCAEVKLMRNFTCRNAIVTWIKKKIGPGIYNITTTEDAKRVLTSENKVVIAYLDSLVVYFAYSILIIDFLLLLYSFTEKLSPGDKHGLQF